MQRRLPGWTALARALVAASALAPAGLAAQTASGSLVLDGAATPLSYVYAIAKPGALDKSREDVAVTLSDVPLSEADRESAFGLIRLGRSGQAHIVEILLDADGDPISGAIYAPIFSGMLSLTGMHVFEPTRFDAEAVQGTLRTRARHDFDGHTIEYRASFSVRIPRPPTPAQIAQALAGPAGQAARAHLEALLGGNFPAFLQTLNPDAARDYEGDAGRLHFADYRREMPADAKVVGIVEQSAVAATATVQGHERDIVVEYTLPLERVNGRWVIGK